MKYLMWLLRAAIFFTLFAFALNNQQTVAVHFFFGTLWTAPLVLVVLTAFGSGLAFGILVMMPRWWARRRRPAVSRTAPPVSVPPPAPAQNDPASIARNGL